LKSLWAAIAKSAPFFASAFLELWTLRAFVHRYPEEKKKGKYGEEYYS
jgi:hypothetical protein